MNTNITAEIEVYYDEYEYMHGDGFYPFLKRENASDACTRVGFEVKNNRWLQTTGPYIYGLDGTYGADFLEFLNSTIYKPLVSKELQTTTKLCISAMKKKGMTDKVLSTPLNELSKSEFAYRVIDEMMSCAWEPQAEYIISLIGNGRNAPAPIAIFSKGFEQLYPK